MSNYLTLRKLREDIDKVENINSKYLDLPIFTASKSGLAAVRLVNEKFSGNYIYQYKDYIHLLSNDDIILSNEIPII